MNIVTLCGSLRKESYNRILLRIATGMLEAAGATVTEARFEDVPLYNEDLEVDPWPPTAKRLYDQIAGADAVLIVSPEYNYSIPGALKNAIDWASVGDDAFKGKVVALMGVSIGQYGTTKMQMHLRQALLGTGTVHVIPQPQVAIGPAATAFAADGSLVDANTNERVRQLVANLIETTRQLKR